MRKVYLIDANILPNTGFCWSKAFKYAKLMEEGVEFPAVNIYPHPENNNLTFNDGRHRVAAAKLSGVKLRVKRYFKE